MKDEKKLELLEEMLELDTGSLRPETDLETLDAWDSMAKLSLIVLMEDECGKSLTGSQIRQFITIKDIMDYMD